MKTKLNILIAAVFLVTQMPFSQENPVGNAADQDWINQHSIEILKSTKDLDEKVLKLALANYKQAVDKSVTSSPILSIVDFSKVSGERRLWVIDLFQNRVLFHELVAHGKNSSEKDSVALATKFSNRHHSYQSSLGLFKTLDVYRGTKGQSLRLQGLDEGINDNAEARGVVMHGAHYVNETRAKELGYVGRSYGCLSVRPEVTRKLIDTIKQGTLIYAYHPQLLTIA